jgi:hypothetical protein
MRTELPTHPHLVHPHTGKPLRAVFVSPKTGRVFWPILGAEDPPEPPAYTPPASQADLDRIVEQRLARERSKYSDYDTLKEKAEKHDKLEADLATDKEKAVAAAREEAQKQVRAETAPRLVKQAFKAEAKGVLTSEQLDALLEDLDLTKYLDKDGDVDEEKVTKKVTALAPKKDESKNGGGGTRPLGQGQQRAAGVKPGDAGRAEAQKRFGDRQKQNA